MRIEFHRARNLFNDSGERRVRFFKSKKIKTLISRFALQISVLPHDAGIEGGHPFYLHFSLLRVFKLRASDIDDDTDRARVS
jgi:hypothetical protein